MVQLIIGCTKLMKAYKKDNITKQYISEHIKTAIIKTFSIFLLPLLDC